MERVLVGVDGSACSMHALQWAADLAKRARLEVVLARVHEAAHSMSPVEQEAALRERQRQELEEWCSSLPYGCDRRRAVLLEGDPPDALVDAANFQHADLLVVGSRGAGGFAHLHIGSVAHHLLHLTHRTTLPLAVIPPTAPLAIKRLVVGNDGSAGSAAGVELTAKLARLLHVPVTAVYSFEPLIELNREGDVGNWRRRAEADVRGWTTPIEKAGVALDIYIDHVRDIHPVAAIEYALRGHSGSVAVLGTRGLGGFSGLRLGRVPLQLVNHTGHAVILVPPLS